MGAKRKVTRKAGKMEVFFVNNAGGGFADTLEVDEGCTAGELFEDMMEGAESANYMISINRDPATEDQVIESGDKVTITPTAVKGS